MHDLFDHYEKGIFVVVANVHRRRTWLIPTVWLNPKWWTATWRMLAGREYLESHAEAALQLPPSESGRALCGDVERRLIVIDGRLGGPVDRDQLERALRVMILVRLGRASDPDIHQAEVVSRHWTAHTAENPGWWHRPRTARTVSHSEQEFRDQYRQCWRNWVARQPSST